MPVAAHHPTSVLRTDEVAVPLALRANGLSPKYNICTGDGRFRNATA
jgi:hypothetical protein